MAKKTAVWGSQVWHIQYCTVTCGVSVHSVLHCRHSVPHFLYTCIKVHVYKKWNVTPPAGQHSPVPWGCALGRVPASVQRWRLLCTWRHWTHDWNDYIGMTWGICEVPIERGMQTMQTMHSTYIHTHPTHKPRLIYSPGPTAPCLGMSATHVHPHPQLFTQPTASHGQVFTHPHGHTTHSWQL